MEYYRSDSDSGFLLGIDDPGESTKLPLIQELLDKYELEILSKIVLEVIKWV